MACDISLHYKVRSVFPEDFVMNINIIIILATVGVRPPLLSIILLDSVHLSPIRMKNEHLIGVYQVRVLVTCQSNVIRCKPTAMNPKQHIPECY